MKNKSDYLTLLTNNYCKLHSFVLCMMCCKEDTDDIMQEVSIVMWEKFDEFEPGTNFIAWAKSIARNKIMDYNKTNKRSNSNLEPQVMELLMHEREKYEDTPSQKMDALKMCLKKMNSNDIRIVKLRYFESRSVKDISKIIGIPLHTMYRKFTKIHELLLACVRRNMAVGSGSHE